MLYRISFLMLMVFALPAMAADDAKVSESKAESTAKAEDSEAEDSHSKEAHEEDGHDESVHHDDTAHGKGAHGGSESDPNPLATDPDLALWTLGVFLLMLFVLKAFAWTPIMEGLKAREEGITGNLAAADAKHEEAKALLAEHQAKLAGAADEVRELLEEARRDAEQTKADIMAEAKAAADSERERAVRDVEQARDTAVRQLAESSAGIAIDLAAKVVKQEIGPGRQGEIVQEALGRVAGGDPSVN